MAPIRSRGSVELDEKRTKTGTRIGDKVPFERWDIFERKFHSAVGDHITTIGPTKSGKTVLNRKLLIRRTWVVVLGVKNRDPELYGPFEEQGYVLERHFEPEPPASAQQHRVLFVPQTNKRGTEARKVKAAAFRAALNDIYDTGYWCVYADDIQYMSDQLRLGDDFEELWMLGRSEGVTVVASSQEPVNIPPMAYGMATHLFLFKNPDLYRARRMAELTGVNRDLVTPIILDLPQHEFLYINKDTGRMVRSMVIV